MNVLVVFFIQMFELFLGIVFWKGSSRGKNLNHYRSLSNRDKVLYLERTRKGKGYKKAWLYYKCKEQGLLGEYNKLYKSDSQETMKKPQVPIFGFGKYKGQPVEEVWNNDRRYINWALNNVDFEEHPAEEFAIDYLAKHSH